MKALGMTLLSTNLSARMGEGRGDGVDTDLSARMVEGGVGWMKGDVGHAWIGTGGWNGHGMAGQALPTNRPHKTISVASRLRPCLLE